MSTLPVALTVFAYAIVSWIVGSEMRAHNANGREYAVATLLLLGGLAYSILMILDVHPPSALDVLHSVFARLPALRILIGE